jgi:hypothetical protein
MQKSYPCFPYCECILCEDLSTKPHKDEKSEDRLRQDEREFQNDDSR